MGKYKSDSNIGSVSFAVAFVLYWFCCKLITIRMLPIVWNTQDSPCINCTPLTQRKRNHSNKLTQFHREATAPADSTLNHPGPQFPHLWSKDNNADHLTHFPEGWRKVIKKKKTQEARYKDKGHKGGNTNKWPWQTGRNDWSHFDEFLSGSCSPSSLHWWCWG